MPRVKRKELNRTALTEPHIHGLLVGELRCLGHESAAREAWEEHRDALLEEWIGDNPCTRPWPW